MNCIEAIDVMGDAAEDRLDPSYAAGFQEHMEECPPCATYYEQLRITRLALRNLDPAAPEAPERRAELIATFRRAFGEKKN